MPSYNFYNKKTKKEFDMFMSISELEQYLKDNPHIEQAISSPAIADPTRLGLRKPDSGFRDVLKKAKSAHKGSTINTW